MSAASTAAPRPHVTREDAEGVAVLTLDRPEARNSLSEAMMGALQAELDAVARDRAVRVVVLAANGPVFCAGHDLKEMTAARARPDRGRAYFAEIMGRCARLMTSIVRLPQPVIAEVRGIATAAGCQLVASCDLAVASDEARFCTPGVSIGLFCSTPMVALSRNVTRKAAMEMLLTGDMVGAEEARALGLVNRVVPPAALREATQALARGIAARSAATVKLGKEAFYRQAEMSLDEAYRFASEVMVDNMLARDAEEGIGAFIEKRPPRWG
jgi:enoyl-CoA hydratase/carnithine racemase